MSVAPKIPAVANGAGSGAEAESREAKVYREKVQPIVVKFCVDCHNNRKQNGEVNFEASTDFAAALAQGQTWGKARKMLDEGTMPPLDRLLRPNRAEVAEVMGWIDRAFADANCGKRRDPGHVTVRRLNRMEYDNTIRDLIGVALHAADDFPSDDVGNGFDNMGDVLSISPLLMENYVNAAERISSIALFGVDPQVPPVHEFGVSQLVGLGSARIESSGLHGGEAWGMASLGEVDARLRCPADADYFVRFTAGVRDAGNEPTRMALRLDGRTVRVIELRGDLEPTRVELRFPLEAGPHHFSAAFANDTAEPLPPELPRDPKHPRAETGEFPAARELFVRRIEIEGPVQDPRKLAERSAQFRQQFRFRTPGGDESPADCAARFLTAFATRAFRRPASPEETKPYVALVAAAAQHALGQKGRSKTSAVEDTGSSQEERYARDPGRDDGDSRFAPVFVPDRAAWSSGRGKSAGADRTLRTCVAAVVLSVEQHAGRRVVPAGRGWKSVEAGRSGSSNAANAPRSEIANAGHEFRRAVAEPRQARPGQSGSGNLHDVRRRSPQRHAAGN